ncbi:MAG: 2,3-bisphosphoglycerate-independent phosphoglycerate mutase, partial [Patescibacteria group bacterium]
LERINMAIAEGTFLENEVFLNAIEHTKKNKSDLHLMGLIGAGGDHSNIEHLYALIRISKLKKVKNLYLHLFTDGRDSPPTSALTYISQVNDLVAREGVGTISTIMGRYWAMDRDNHWERTAKAYFALTQGKGRFVKNTTEAIRLSYENGEIDEFIEPCLISDSEKNSVKVKNNDAVIFFNFRIDRPRQLTYAFLLKDLKSATKETDHDPYMFDRNEPSAPKKKGGLKDVFERGEPLKNLYFATMTEYSKSLTAAGAVPAYPPEKIGVPLGNVLSASSMKQLRITESEKERFVTFYFNGLSEKPFKWEDRIIVPSPKVRTYDQKPEMSSQELTDKLMKQLKKHIYKLIVVNYPNPDMVAHTGNIVPAVKACEVVDKHLGTIAHFALAYGGVLIITADHGNVEEMIDTHSEQINTEHSKNTVPFIVVSRLYLGNSRTLQSGILADVAPTILALLGIEKPLEMTGRNLLKELSDQ